MSNLSYPQLQCPFGDPKAMSFHEPARDVKLVGNFRNAQPFKHCAKYELISRLQSIFQHGKDIVSVDCGHNAIVEIQSVQPFVPSSAVVRKRCLRTAVLG